MKGFYLYTFPLGAIRSLILKSFRVFFLISICLVVKGSPGNNRDTTPFSTAKEALEFLAQQTKLTQSSYWPNIKPATYLENLKKNIQQPLSLYEGTSTNFCAYAALSYLPLHDDPLTFVRFMLTLYQKGKARYGKVLIRPSASVRQAAGTLSFKGELDIRPADQLWFLVLADHFKGYLNLFDHHYDKGNENTFWAAVNFSKFNRMIRRLFNYRVDAVGSDLIRPGIRDIYLYLSERLASGYVALYVNNPFLYKKNHAAIRFNIPTHFIILLNIEEVGDKLAITYWDYGGLSLQMLSPTFLRKIIFGVAHITPKLSDEE